MQLQKTDGLIVVDLQRDFVDGSLAVPGSTEIIPNVVDAIAKFQTQGLPIALTRCWHPANHCSFKEFGGQWPAHCVQGTTGAEFIDEIRMGAGVVFSKGQDPNENAYSGFQGTSLHAWLRDQNVTRVFAVGLAQDYCVLHTVKDALKLGYQTVLLGDATVPVNVRPGDGSAALQQMYQAGALARDVKWIRSEAQAG